MGQNVYGSTEETEGEAGVILLVFFFHGLKNLPIK